MLMNICDGDARLALNTLEISVKTKESQLKELKALQTGNCEGVSSRARTVTADDIKKSLLTKHYYYDRSGLFILSFLNLS